MEKMSLLQFCDVEYVYPDGKQALSEINFSLARGEKLAVVGANGAGKSTLLLLSCGIITPTRGYVKFKQENLAAKNRQRFRGATGILFQDPDDQLFCPSVQEDVSFGPLNLGIKGEELAERVRESLAKVGLSGFERRIPHHLSVGERKRVALATVLAMRPEVLLLDEPTGNLDPRGRRELAELLYNMRETVLLATHDLELAQTICSRVLILSQGKVVAGGYAKEILSDEGLLFRCGL
jgi:cobalt/nickel transport system ATP-binding protein